MSFTTISSAARRSLLGAVVALAIAVAFVASASSAKAATGSPIGKLDNAGGTIWNGVVSGWAADLDVPSSSAINVRLDLYRYQQYCAYAYGGVCWVTAWGDVLVDSQTQTANVWNSEAWWALGTSSWYGGGNVWNGYHGFRFAFDPYYGLRAERACVTALNVGAGSDTPLGCVSLVWIG
jgi:hypothetical protein